MPSLRDGRFEIPVFGISAVIAALGMCYGLCMGIFALTSGGSGDLMQVFASMVKVPALFILTLLVTFPSLYVFNALVGSQLLLPAVFRLLIASLAVMLAVLSSIGPIVAFFSFTTTSYHFMVLLNVLVFAIAGFLGLAFMLQTLHRLTQASKLLRFAPTGATLASPTPAAASTVEAAFAEKSASAAELSPAEQNSTVSPPIPSPGKLGSAAAGPLDDSSDHVLGSHVNSVFRIWILVFGLVGAQMAWVLRPFIGHPGQPFTWFRHSYANFFQAVYDSIVALANQR